MPLTSSGDRIRYARQKNELTMKELSQVAEISITSIGYIERNVVVASLPTLRKLSKCLKEPIHFLGCFEGMPEDTIGQRFKKARYYRGLLGREAADLICVDEKTINNWESGRKVPSNKYYCKIKEFLKIIEI
ncbi:helix-turn-helix domain-containing protein [Paenibacillus antibioticophila]|nr:helix-turn-helix transcriptional regulator [Paenibacillus antibioticophila]